MTDDDRMEGRALSEVLYERQGPIAIITLNRPEKLNAFNAQLLINFTKALDLAERDETARVVIVKGAGRAFSVGYDVSPGEYSPHHVNIAEDREWLHGAIEKWLRVWEFPKPVIAQVHGYCIAGATMLALCCDITIVSNECKIRWPSLPLGGGLISTMWTWLSGPKKAKEMSFIAGSEMTGAEAHFWGFANRAVPEAELEAVTLRMARQIARTPPDLLRLKKLAINRIMDIQGFRTAAMFGAEWDSIAHFSTGAMNVAEKIQELGLKGAIKWLEAQDE
jgi:enoyl-CoA hydratase